MSTDSDIFMHNEANFRSSRTGHGVVTGQRVSTRCGRNRVEQSVASCERSEEAGQRPVERKGKEPEMREMRKTKPFCLGC